MKKGIESLTLVTLALTIIVLVSGFFIGKFVLEMPAKTCDSATEACRVSVLASNYANEVGIDLPANCPGKTIKFTNEEPNEVNRIISQEIEKCIYKFQEGKIDFSKGSLIKNLGLSSNQIACFRCADFDFSNYKKKDKYLDENKKGNYLLKIEKEQDTICAKPKQKVFDFIDNIRKSTFDGSKFMYIQDLDSIDFAESDKYILFTSTWNRGIKDEAILMGSKVSASIIKNNLLENVFSLYSRLGILDFYEKSGKYVPIASSINLVPSTSNNIQDCELFYQ